MTDQALPKHDYEAQALIDQPQHQNYLDQADKTVRRPRPRSSQHDLLIGIDVEPRPSIYEPLQTSIRLTKGIRQANNYSRRKRDKTTLPKKTIDLNKLLEEQRKEEERERENFAKFLSSPIIEEMQRKNSATVDEHIAQHKEIMRRKNYNKIQQDQQKNKLIRMSFHRKESGGFQKRKQIDEVRNKLAMLSNTSNDQDRMKLVRQEIQRVRHQMINEQLREREYYLNHSVEQILVKVKHAHFEKPKNQLRTLEELVPNSNLLAEQERLQVLKKQRKKDTLASLLFCLTVLAKQSQDQPLDLADNKIFCSQPFSRPGSFSFFQNIKQKKVEQVALLLKSNPTLVFDFDQFRQTGLHLAIRGRSVAMVELLLMYEPDINFRDYFLRTPMYFALQQSDIQISHMLLMHGASPWASVRLDYHDYEMNQKQRILLKKAKQAHICAMFCPGKQRLQMVRDILHQQYQE